MYSLIDLFYFGGSIILTILAALSLKEAKKTGFKNDMFLAFFFFSIGWLFPLLIFFPFKEKNEEVLQFLLIGANLLIPFILLFFNLFIDFSIKDNISFFTLITSLLGSIANGLFLAPANGKTEWIDTIYGKYMTVKYDGIEKSVAYLILMIIVILNLLRVIIIGIKVLKENRTAKNSKYTKKFLIFLFLGGFLWLLFTLLKRIPMLSYYLTGFDYLFISLFYTWFLYIYFKNRELFYFLPGTLQLAILLNNAGMHLFDYDFKKNRVIKHDFKNNSKNNRRSLLYGITTLLETAVSDSDSDSIKNQSLHNISFTDSQIISYNSANLHWLLISNESSKKYNFLLKRIALSIEEEFSEEIIKFENGKIPSKQFQDKVKKKLKKLS